MRIAASALILGLVASTSSAQQQVNDSSRCSALEPQFCLNGVSSAVTGLDALRIGVAGPTDRQEEERKRRKTAGFTRIDIAASDRVSGVLSQDPLAGWAIWAGYGRADFESTGAVAPYASDLDAYRIGIDKRIGQNVVLGAAGVFDRIDSRTRFNGGGQNTDIDTVVPYLTFLVSDTVSLDLNAGYGRVSIGQNRIDPTSVPGSPAILIASFDGRRHFWSATLNVFRPVGNWTLGGRIGYLDSREKHDPYTETGGPSARTVRERNLKLAQAYAGIDAAYLFANNLEAYASGIYRRDTGRDDGSDAGGLPSAVGSTLPGDRSEFEWTLGLRFFGAGGLTLGAEWMKTTHRDQFKHHAVNLLVRFDF